MLHLANHCRKLPLALLLALALLCAQWQGLAHRIAHSQLASAASPVVQSEKDGSPQHSCAAFDAATVGDSIHLAPYVLPLPASLAVLSLWQAFASWDAPCSPGFSSRAPPAIG